MEKAFLPPLPHVGNGPSSPWTLSWEKEERNNPKIRHAIKTISFRNMKLAALWSDTYPESKDCDSYVNERYMKLIKESTGGSGEIIDNENKIIRRIAKEIIIDKK